MISVLISSLCVGTGKSIWKYLIHHVFQPRYVCWCIYYIFSFKKNRHYLQPVLYFPQECENYAREFEVVSFMINPPNEPSWLLGNVLFLKFTWLSRKWCRCSFGIFKTYSTPLFKLIYFVMKHLLMISLTWSLRYKILQDKEVGCTLILLVICLHLIWLWRLML